MFCVGLESIIKGVMKATKATVYRFLREHHDAVLATVSNINGCSPMTSPITYCFTDKKTVCFVTGSGTNKHDDIQKCGCVAFTVLDDELPLAVNMVANAKVVNNPEASKRIFKKMGEVYADAGRVPPVFVHKRGDVVAIELTPKRMQYNDFTGDKSDSSIVDI